MTDRRNDYRLIGRPDIDPSDDESVRALAKSLTKWALEHQERIQREIVAERMRLALESSWDEVEANGTDKIPDEEIDAVIRDVRAARKTKP